MNVERKTFGKMISLERKERKWSLSELAQRVSKEDGKPISPQYLNDIEHDRRLPSEQIISQLAKALGINADLLRLLAGQALPEIKGIAENNPENALQFAKAFRKTINKALGKET